MNSYTDIDGVPSAADESLLTGLLRDTWGFAGTVVADYFAIAFLVTQHGVAADWTDAAHQALAAGIDVQLPGRKTFHADPAGAGHAGVVPAALHARRLRRARAPKRAAGPRA